MKRIVTFLLGLVFSLHLSAQLPADAPRSKSQFEALEKQASGGSLHAKYVLACCYMNGLNGIVAPKLSKGKKLLKQAADSGDADACRLMYKIEPLRNAIYLEKAIDGYRSIGTANAFFCIADLYANDPKMCRQWLKTAMLAGSEQAANNLRAMHKAEGNSTSFDSWCEEIEAFNVASVPKTAILAAPVEEENDDVDFNIPRTKHKNRYTVAVIIGNEQYQQVAEVPYATNDASVFAQYCQKTLGLPAENVRSYLNATYGVMLSAINDIKNISDAYNGDISILFYYAGHGIPDEKNKDAFLLPVDADGKNIEVCYPLKRLYQELGGIKAKQVVVFMDACFSGSVRGDGMLMAARGVAIKAKELAPQGNMVVFSASQGDETAFPYKKKKHGMFTFYLLKKLQESEGGCNLSELCDYVKQQVRQNSVMVNHKSQTPTVTCSPSLAKSWEQLKLK